MADLTPTHKTCSLAEQELLAERIADRVAARESYYREKWGLDPEAAQKRAFGTPEKAINILENKPASQITWDDYCVVHRSGPEGATTELWNRLKEEARSILDSGLFVSAALAERSPLKRAMCLAAVEHFSEEWKPQGGIEQTLVGMLAQTFVKWQFWLDMEIKWGFLKDDYAWSEREEPHNGAKLNYADSSEYAANMADRGHRQFMRTLRAMRDLRRYAPITINNQGQVNIGQHQVNQSGDFREAE